jgi:cyclopropane fatty-acyl-phospholipid synthase-like methyltransferase
MKYADMNRIYQNIPLDAIPWNIPTPPGELVALIKSGRVRLCKTVDLGCGAGNYAIYLAGLGFDTTGIDNAESAVQLARENAQKKGVACRFIVADLLGDMHEVEETFDFAFEWEVLHHIFPDDRARYVNNVRHLLNPNALYFSVCFAESDPQFGGTGKYRKTPIGTTLYFSSESELRDLFSRFFVVDEMRTIETGGKYGSHTAVYTLMKRK